MSDKEHIAELVARASNAGTLLAAQHEAAAKLLRTVHETYPHDGCAITQSCLLQDAGIDVPDTYQALAFGKMLEGRGWQRIVFGEQAPGDIGSTCGTSAHHGDDHVYLVLHALNADEMVVADNQSHAPHFRFASGRGKTPTRFFLRAT